MPLQVRPAWNCWSGVRPLRLIPGWPLIMMDGPPLTGCKAVRIGDVVTRHRAGDRPLSKRQLKPTHGEWLPGNLILEVRGLVEALVMVDAEGIAAAADGCACACDLRREEPRRDRRHDDERREVVEVRNIGA